VFKKHSPFSIQALKSNILWRILLFTAFLGQKRGFEAYGLGNPLFFAFYTCHYEGADGKICKVK
jgi:hypothetical protein